LGLFHTTGILLRYKGNRRKEITEQKGIELGVMVPGTLGATFSGQPKGVPD